MEYEKKEKNQIPGISLTNPDITAADITAQSQENNWSSKPEHLFFMDKGAWWATVHGVAKSQT